MAFGIKRTALTGITTKYHKISSFEVDFINKKCIVTLDDYLTEDYRNKAKEQEALMDSIAKLLIQANTSNKDTSNALLLKATKLQEDNKELLDKNFVADKTTIILDYIPEKLTLESFYNELAKLEEFKNVENV